MVQLDDSLKTTIGAIDLQLSTGFRSENSLHGDVTAAGLSLTVKTLTSKRRSMSSAAVTEALHLAKAERAGRAADQ
ncbi:hypothetical protein KIPE111705_23665 [Kibdelosporangium persicum]|uniref:hypothetical protein n=1 Tax=Kibdelosporangium persicum TaxID=2698649 RepID=UPI001564E499|nr:hypothetical protein [Kibdelosporangium persicum]